ncbi:MAG: DUF2125 domain-containing protein, partial [Caulobacterales bacterium]
MSDSETAPKPRHRRLGLIIPWAIFAALLLAWTIYWFALAHAVRTQFDAVIAAQRAQGAEISIGEVKTRGYPLQLALDISGASYQAPGGSWRAATPNFLIHVNPTNPSHVIATFPEVIDGVRDGRAHRISAEALRVSVRMKGTALAQAGVEAHAFNIFDVADNAPDYDIED